LFGLLLWFTPSCHLAKCKPEGSPCWLSVFLKLRY
jgi:hypothetical protein